MRQAIADVLTRCGAFARYLYDYTIDIDNNARERCMRRPALGSKSLLFAGSADGGKANVSSLTVIQRAQLCEAEPFAYASDLLTRLAESRDMTAERRAAEGEAFLRDLVSAVWVASNPEKRLPLAR